MHRLYAVAVLLPLTITSMGCRAHPGSLVTMVVSDVVDDADVKKRESELVGQSPTVADASFGARIDTLTDTRRPGRELLLYPVKLDLAGTARFGVEVVNGRISAIMKGKRNIDGIEDVVKQAGLEKKLLGKAPATCEGEGELGTAVAVYRSRERGGLVRIYDVRNFTNLRGARYCMLWFDASERCEEVRLVGVSGATKKQLLG